jgi:hypothetical protein
MYFTITYSIVITFDSFKLVILIQILCFWTLSIVLLLSKNRPTSSIDWAQLSRFYLKTETESSLRNVVFSKIIDQAKPMDNDQKHNIRTNIQTFRSYGNIKYTLLV